MSLVSLAGLHDLLSPFFRRPPAVQMAALCYRDGSEGPEVLLVRSSAGRWILPKGWPMDGKNGAETAMTEAWEEAGVAKGKAARDPLGSFRSQKALDDGPVIRCETYVYPVQVRKIANDYPDAGRRDRRWVSLGTAPSEVSDAGLAELLRLFAGRIAA